MIELANKTNCCGCGACVLACPKKALTLQPDEDGFLYPVLDEALCIHCDRCSKVCTYQNQEPRGSIQETYAAYAEGIDRSLSASGGVFAGLAKAVLARRGSVFGSTLTSAEEGLSVHHISIQTEEELPKLQGSKYVQSSIGKTYREAKSLLDQGISVLFSGTPCQIAGLYGFLGKDYDNLYTVDIVCHGVPSGKMFQDYLKFEETKRKGKIVDYRFRDKSQGWKLFGKMTIEDRSGTRQDVLFEPEESSFYQLFLNGYTYRENCYSCPYAGSHRSGDLTIGDFWGIEVVQPELLKENGGPLDESKGISCVIVNTEKGRKLLTDTSEIQLFASTFENARKYNGQLREPSKIKPERESVLNLYKKSYNDLEKWYRRRLAGIRFRRSIRKAVPKGIKRVVKSLLKRR